MEYIVVCYNILTLSRAVYYAEKRWGLERTHIIYSDVFSALPPTLKEKYAVTVISQDGLDSERGIKAVIDSCIWTKKICNALAEVINKCNECTLVVFRDNEIQEATAIEYCKRLKKSIRIVLMEEGSGLYAVAKTEISHVSIKRFIYKIFHVSTYPLQNKPQGCNPLLDRIICNKPDQLTDKIGRSSIPEIEKLEDVFTPDFSGHIIEAMTGKAIDDCHYDYVFLTQPFSMFREEEETLRSIHEKLLPEVFSILRKRGRVLVKLHPREDYDYSGYAGENVVLSSDREQAIPFECLMGCYGNPQMISMFSSVSFNIIINKPSLFLYKLFRIPGAEHLFSDDLLKKNNIIVCESMEDFENCLV